MATKKGRSANPRSTASRPGRAAGRTKSVEIRTLNKQLTIRVVGGRRIAPPPLSVRIINGTLLRSAELALERPGIPESVVFGKNKGVNSYSVDPKDPSRLLRQSASGRQVVGRMIGGQFRALRSN